MGNISNPCVNRWGINSFWSHYWYTDTKYNVFLKQDATLTLLLRTYLYYGTETTPNFWQDPFWHKSSNYSYKSELHYDCRWFIKHELDLGYSIAYVIRNESAESFEARWTILRFNKWFVISASWFQPDKLKNKRRRKSKIVHQMVTTFPPKSSNYKQKFLLIRLNNLLKKNISKTTISSDKYVF